MSFYWRCGYDDGILLPLLDGDLAEKSLQSLWSFWVDCFVGLACFLLLSTTGIP
jgi:hypothetical protein